MTKYNSTGIVLSGNFSIIFLLLILPLFLHFVHPFYSYSSFHSLSHCPICHCQVVGLGGSLVDSSPLVRWVVGSNPALVATQAIVQVVDKISEAIDQRKITIGVFGLF